MNDEIKAQVRAEMDAQGLSVTTLADDLGTSRENLSRLLGENNQDRRGQIPKLWQRVLDRLGLTLTTRPKQ